MAKYSYSGVAPKGELMKAILDEPTRDSARKEILELANKRRRDIGRCEDRYRMKHLNRAVFAVRQSGDAPKGLFVRAGFRGGASES